MEIRKEIVSASYVFLFVEKQFKKWKIGKLEISLLEISEDPIKILKSFRFISDTTAFSDNV